MSDKNQQEEQEKQTDDRANAKQSDLARSSLSVLVERVDRLIAKHRVF